MAYNLPDDVTDEMVDRATGGYDPRDEPEEEGPYWLRNTGDRSLALHRADGSVFAGVNRNQRGEFAAWTMPQIGKTPYRSWHATEEQAMAACNAALEKETR